MKIFVSIPMRDRSDKDILEEISTYAREIGDAIALHNEAFEKVWLGENFDNDIEYVHNLFCDIGEHNNSKPNSEPVLYLAEALKKMTTCDCILFAPAYRLARDCWIESEAATQYQLYNKSIYITKYEIDFRKDDGLGHSYFAYNRKKKTFTNGFYAPEHYNCN